MTSRQQLWEDDTGCIHCGRGPGPEGPGSFRPYREMKIDWLGNQKQSGTARQQTAVSFQIGTHSQDGCQLHFLLLFLGDHKLLSVYFIIYFMISDFWHGCWRRNNQHENMTFQGQSSGLG